MSAEIVKEMSSDAVSKSLAYLREKARFLSARADFIYEHNGKTPESVSSGKPSSRDKLLRWMETDPLRVPSGASSFGRLIDAWAGVHSDNPAPKPSDGNDGLGSVSLTAPTAGDKDNRRAERLALARVVRSRRAPQSRLVPRGETYSCLRVAL